MKNKESAGFLKLKMYLDKKLNSIEELLHLILLSDVMNQLENSMDNKKIDENELDKELQTFLKLEGLEIFEQHSFYQYKIMYLKSDLTFGIRKMRYIADFFLRYSSDIVPVFMFEKISETKREKIEQERFSYIIEGEELHITV